MDENEIMSGRWRFCAVVRRCLDDPADKERKRFKVKKSIMKDCGYWL